MELDQQVRDVTSRDTDEQVLDFDDDTLNGKIVYHQKALNVARINSKIYKYI